MIQILTLYGDDHYNFCGINGKYIKEDLFSKLFPIISYKSHFVLYNINHLTESDLEVLESQFDEYTSTDRRTITEQRGIDIYPEEADEKFISKVNFDVLTTLLPMIKNSFISNIIGLAIYNGEFTYAQILKLSAVKFGSNLYLSNCSILSSRIPSNSGCITQRGIFIDGKFDEEYKYNKFPDFILNISKRQDAIKNLSLMKIENNKAIYDIFTYLPNLKNKRSLIYNCIVEKTISLISFLNDVKFDLDESLTTLIIYTSSTITLYSVDFEINK